MGGRGRVVAAVLVVASLLGVPAGAGDWARAQLPAPTGPFGVGTVAVPLTDDAREDPWVPGQPRRLMVSVWYPAGPGGERARYMVPEAAAHFGGPAGAGLVNYGVTPGSTDWAGIGVRAREGAPVAAGGRRPVVLYSAGLGDPRTWGTALVADLASRGYLVVTVDHTYEASEVAFPGRPLATSVLPGLLGQPGLDVGALLRKAVDVRVADTRFVLDRLARLGEVPGLPAGLADALDLTRIGMAGHSAGGFTALQTMHDDPRIAAGVDLDGQLHFPGPDGRTGVYLSTVAEDGLDRPFLLLGTRDDGSGDYHHQPGWAALWQHSHGWHADFTMEGSRHGSYTDAEPLLPQLAPQGALDVGRLEADIGGVPADRAEDATRSYVAAFFDRWLRGRDTRLLDGPSPRFPEMTWTP
ncbi:alpha/beta hydrolase family protein [Kitasatospora sp. NPDC092948]|uniref:alpha/beta hydrolase family protein n=1 Tax=Kitasatospora sp. NPDC092948 TaxID=3364088 RepID=UPI00381DBA4F